MSRPRRLRDLHDVSKTAPSDGQVYSYNAASGLLVPTTLSTGGGGGGVSLRTKGSDAYNTLIASSQAYWDLETNTWLDAGPNGINLTASGTPVVCRGGLGNAARTRVGSSEKFVATDAAALHFGDIDWTVTCWALSSSVNTCVLFNKGSATRDCLIQSVSGGNYKLYVGGASIQSLDAFGSGTWHFVRVWHSAHVIYIAVDEGEPDSTAGTPPAATTDDVWISADKFTGASFFEGRVRHVGIFHKLLSSAEIDVLWNQGMGP